MLRMIVKTLKILNSETDPLQISLAVVLAMVIGFTPVWSIHTPIILLLVLVLRVNLSTFILCIPIFGALGYVLDPAFHRLGLALLSADSLRAFWTWLYNTIPGRLERVNNTIVVGTHVASLVLAVPVLLASNILIRQYRERILAVVGKTRIAQAIKASRFYSLYESLGGWGGGR